MAQLSERSSRVADARKLTRRAGRERAGLFLAEGAQAVREALAAHSARTATTREVFVTEEARIQHPELVESARAVGVAVSGVTERAAASLSETVTPQGLVAVCRIPRTAVAETFPASPKLVAVLVDVADPGNAGTVIRVADAAGAEAVLFAGNSVEPWNGKAVRASTGSLFHLPVVRDRDTSGVLAGCRQAGLRVIGADGYADDDLDAADLRGELSRPTAWVFGGEARGLPARLASELDATARVPLYGQAESLNLGAAAAVCLYASARAQRRRATQTCSGR